MSTYLGVRPLPTKGSRLVEGLKKVPVIQSVYTRIIDSTKASKMRIMKKHPELWKDLNEVQQYWTDKALAMPEIRYAVEDHFEKWANSSPEGIFNLVSELYYAPSKVRHFAGKHISKLIEAPGEEQGALVRMLNRISSSHLPWLDKNLDKVLSLSANNIQDISNITQEHHYIFERSEHTDKDKVVKVLGSVDENQF